MKRANTHAGTRTHTHMDSHEKHKRKQLKRFHLAAYRNIVGRIESMFLYYFYK